MWGVPVETVDKDWVLGHVLSGIFRHETLRSALVFKGGTCLRKLYFPGYRFSEDLDFTALDALPEAVFRSAIRESMGPVYRDTGIHFGKASSRPSEFKDELKGLRFRLPYWGSTHIRGRRIPDDTRWPRITIDVTLNEKVNLPIARKVIMHPYPDHAVVACEIPAYSLEEIVAEKLRCLFQRFRPRDYYDLWYLWTYSNERIDWLRILEILAEKCRIKGMMFDGPKILPDCKKLTQNKRDWHASLSTRLREPPSVEMVAADLEKAFKFLFQ